MNSIKKATATIAVFGIIILGVNSVQAGMLMSDFAGGNDNQPCVEKVDTKDGQGTKVDHGIIISGLATIFGNGVVDALFGKSDADVQTNCGIIISG